MNLLLIVFILFDLVTSAPVPINTRQECLTCIGANTKTCGTFVDKTKPLIATSCCDIADTSPECTVGGDTSCAVKGDFMGEKFCEQTGCGNTFAFLEPGDTLRMGGNISSA